jgi:hypothetical protein
VRRGRTYDAGNISGLEARHMNVRGFTVAVVGSVLVHVLVLAIVTARDIELPAAEVVLDEKPTPVEVPAPAEPPPIEVTFLDDIPPGAAGMVVTAATEAPPAKQRGRITQPGSTGSETPGGSTPGTDGTSRSPYLTMRKPGEIELEGPSGGFFDKFLENSKPVPPPADIPGERVGNEIAELRAQLKRAGRYSPEELAGKRAQLVALNEERANEELKPGGGGTFQSTKQTFRAKVNADGSVKLQDQNLGGMDKYMKDHGNDPYRANKLAYLDRTRDQRVAIGKRYREQELKKSVIYMQGNIARLNAMTTDVQKRKQGLFDLWDECAETGTPEEIDGGESARAFVMNHIRGTVRYTPAELRALNAHRHSKQEFAP